MPVTALPQAALGDAKGVSSDRRQSWRRLTAFAVSLLVALGVMTALSRSLPPAPPARFDSAALAKVKRARPEFVLLGNSMVGTRFDEGTLRTALQPRRVVVLGISASKSAEWYLALKNLVVASGYLPRVILFYRGEELTLPRLHTLGPAHLQLERLSVGSELLVENKLRPSLTTPIALVEWYRERVMPFQRLQEKARPLPNTVGDWVSPLLAPAATPATKRDQINALFALSNLRNADVIREPAQPYEDQVFDDAVGPSFLPAICDVAKAHGIPLTFVNVRTREAASGVPETPGERRFMTDMAGYVRGKCGAEFYDMRDEAWESLDMYGNGDHIAGRFRRRYTELFVERMARIFH